MKTKDLLIILIFISVITLLNGCTDKGNLKDFELNGNVKTCIQYEYLTTLKFGEWVAEDFLVSKKIINFNEQGYYTSIDVMGEENENLINRIIPKYEKDKKIEESTYNNDGTLSMKLIIKHISNKEQLHAIFDSKGEKFGEYRVFLNKNKIIMVTDSITVQSNCEKTWFFEYDSNGNIIFEKSKNKDGAQTIINKCKYLEYDKMNNWIKRINFHGNNKNPTSIEIRRIEYF